MPDKAQWDIEHLKQENQRQDERLAMHDKEIKALQSFQDSTVEKLITIFNTINDMKEDSKWMKRMFTSTLIGGIVTAVVSLLVWLIQM